MPSGGFSNLIRVGTLALLASRVGRTLIPDTGSRDGPPPRGRGDLGDLLAGIARERMDDRISANEDASLEDCIARRLEVLPGRRFARREIRNYLDGSRPPPPRFILAFAEAYSLTVRERRLIAWAHTFSEAPHPRTLEAPPPPSGEGESTGGEPLQ